MFFAYQISFDSLKDNESKEEITKAKIIAEYEISTACCILENRLRSKNINISYRDTI